MDDEANEGKAEELAEAEELVAEDAGAAFATRPHGLAGFAEGGRLPWLRSPPCDELCRLAEGPTSGKTMSKIRAPVERTDGKVCEHRVE